MDSLAFLAEVAVASNPLALIERVTGNRHDDWQSVLFGCDETFVLLLASRGVGKSTSAAILAYQLAELWSEQTILIVAPAQRQSLEVQRRVADARRGFGATQILTRETLTEMHLRNGSRIVAVPASSDTIRSYRCDLIILDEAARVDDETFAAIVPMLKENGRLLCATTPAGRRGFFFEKWQAGIGKRITARSLDLPRMARIVARDREIMAPSQFRTEHELAFAGSGDAFFNLDDVQAMFTPDVKPLDLRLVA